jgi:hypothetical protein
VKTLVSWLPVRHGSSNSLCTQSHILARII